MPTNEEIRAKDIVPHKTSFSAGDGFYGDGPQSFFMEADTLLKLTAQNALAGNVVEDFDPTRTNTNPYKAGESVAYGGNTYTFKADHYGAWNAADADKLPMDWIYGYNTEFLLKADNGKNLFNKNTKNKVVGKYVNYSSGVMGNSDSYTAFVVPVPENTDISVRYASVHVAAFSGIPFLPYCNNGAQAGYISGFLTNNNPGGKTWTTPLGTKCVVVSYDNSQVDNGQVELSSAPTTFEPFKTGLDYNKLLNAPDFGEQITALENELKDEITNFQTEVDTFYLKGDTGKNLFNKNTKNSCIGKYVDYGNGKLMNSASWECFVVPVTAGDHISFSGTTPAQIHVAVFSKLPTLAEYNAGEVIDGFINSGFGNTYNQNWEVPATAVCIVVSCPSVFVSSIQVEIGSSSTVYESYKFGLDYNKLLNAPDFGGQITALENELKDEITNFQTEVDTFYLKGDTGKNLFNKNTKNSCIGKYVDYGNGKLNNNASWECFVVPVTAGDHISFRGTTPAQIHVAVFSKLPTLAEYNAGEVIDGFINSGFGNTYNQNWEVPTTAVCIVVSCPSVYVSSIQVEIGSSSTAYESYKFGLDVSRVLGLSNLNNKFLYVGSGQTYTTIMSAVNAANDGDTIVILPGTYNEEVDIRSTGKFLSIIGTQRDKCIITHSNGDYYHAPMEIDKGYVANLTIRATGTTLDVGATMFAYCVHIDYSGEENSALQFVNCNFENDARECVGIGLRENFTLSFKSCSFTNFNLNNLEQARVFYCHEGPGSNHTNQKCELIDCTLFSPSTARAFAVVLQEESTNTGNDATFLIQRSICKTNGSWWASPVLMWDFSTSSPASGGSKWKESNCWNLDVRSALNNESAFNA